MEQDAAFFQIDCPTGSFKRKNRVGAYARDRVIRRRQFHARCGTSSDTIRRLEEFIGLGRRGSLRGSSNDFGLVDNLGENAFRQRRGGVRCEATNNKQSQKKKSDFNVCSGVVSSWPSLHPEMTCQRNNSANSTDGVES
jgi:hypothetical protein